MNRKIEIEDFELIEAKVHEVLNNQITNLKVLAIEILSDKRDDKKANITVTDLYQHDEPRKINLRVSAKSSAGQNFLVQFLYRYKV